MHSNPLNILALETSTEACSAALQSDGHVYARFEIAPRQHTHLLPQMMDAVLAEAGLDKGDINYCALANGPGAFTGIRIAAATAQGIAIGLGIPLVSVSSLATLAQVAFDRYAQPQSTLAALDARMQEVYWGVYQRDAQGLAVLSGNEQLSRCEQVVLPGELDLGCGHGWQVGQHCWAADLGPEMMIDDSLLPDAEAVLKLARQKIQNQQVTSAAQLDINYLRNQVAEKPRQK